MRTYPLDPESTRYWARVWRHETLLREAKIEVEVLLNAFLPAGHVIRIEERDSEVPGFPHAPHYKFSGYFENPNSDAHFFVNAYTREGAKAKLLAHILEGRGYFPLT